MTLFRKRDWKAIVRNQLKHPNKDKRPREGPFVFETGG